MQVSFGLIVTTKLSNLCELTIKNGFLHALLWIVHVINLVKYNVNIIII